MRQPLLGYYLCILLHASACLCYFRQLEPFSSLLEIKTQQANIESTKRQIAFALMVHFKLETQQSRFILTNRTNYQGQRCIRHYRRGAQLSKVGGPFALGVLCQNSLKGMSWPRSMLSGELSCRSCVCVYMYNICIYIYVNRYIYIYTYIYM